MTALVLLATGFGPLAVAAVLAATRPVVRPVVAGIAERVTWALGWLETRQFERDADARFCASLSRWNAQNKRAAEVTEHTRALRTRAVCQ